MLVIVVRILVWLCPAPSCAGPESSARLPRRTPRATLAPIDPLSCTPPQIKVKRFLSPLNRFVPLDFVY